MCQLDLRLTAARVAESPLLRSASAWLNPEMMFAAMAGGGVIYGNVLSTIQMLVTFVTVLFLAGFVLGPPLLRARREGAVLPDGGSALYFSMLGAGFMLVELALMQRLHVVLGHPTYALVVVLASLLVCTGIGSALSSSVVKTPRARRRSRRLCAAILLFALPFVIEPLARATLSSPLSVRVVWTAQSPAASASCSACCSRPASASSSATAACRLRSA